MYDYYINANATTLLPLGTGPASSPKNKRKSKREEKHPAKVEEPKPPSIHARIEQLKQRGVAADSTDDPGDIVIAETTEEGTSEQRQPVAGRAELEEPEGMEQRQPVSGRAEPEGTEQQVAGGIPEQQSELVVTEIQQSEEKSESEVATVPARDGSLAAEEGPEVGLAVEAEGGMVRSKLESGSGGEEPTNSVVEDSIRKLQPFFEAKTAVSNLIINM